MEKKTTGHLGAAAKDLIRVVEHESEASNLTATLRKIFTKTWES